MLRKTVHLLTAIICTCGLTFSQATPRAQAQSCDITVTDGGDSGAGTFRQAVTDAVGGDVICLAVDVVITSPLDVVDNFTIDGMGYSINQLFIQGGNVLVKNIEIYLFSTEFSTVEVNNSLFTYYFFDDGSYVTLNNVTFNGWQFFMDGGNTLFINNSTIVTEEFYVLGTLDIRNSIFNQSIISDYGNGTGVVISNNNMDIASANLGTLQNNGGLVNTMAILPGSAAIDAGNNATCMSTDARGVVRPQGAACDIGAYEYQPPPTATPIPTNTPTPTPTATSFFLPTATPLPPLDTPTPAPTPTGVPLSNDQNAWFVAWAIILSLYFFIQIIRGK